MTVQPATKPWKAPKISWKEDFRKNKIAYLFFLPAFFYFLIFHYIPMSGIAIAFQDYSLTKGIFGSDWVGWMNFEELFLDESFLLVLRNTVAMALLNLTLGFTFPIIFALLLSEIRSETLRRTLQVTSYMPHFVAAVVVCKLVTEFLSANGAVTALLTSLGLERQNWLANGEVPVFWLINCFTEIWQEIGFGSIIYVAAISNVSTDYHEAAAIDGANRWTRMVRITLPCIKPIVMMMFVLKCGLFFTQGFDKVLLLYMPSTYDTADCLTTFTYRMSFSGRPNYGLSTASGLFQSVASLILLIVSNTASRKLTDSALF